tara:strand:+ start:522 stop:761 length:240 start_codon:yes stop_codon:yes gene_type:complete
MATKSSITFENVIDYVKEKWQIFGLSALIIFILQLLSSKVLLSVFLGLIIAALLPSDAVSTVAKRVTKKTTTKKTTTNG